MEKRVYGLETEYGIIAPEAGFLSRDVLELFFKEIFARRDNRRVNSADSFFINGSRIYLETMGSHPEYATPECAGIRDLVKWDKAGERIFEKALFKVNEELTKNNASLYRTYLYKNNIDADGYATFGCHENYQVSRSAGWERLVKNLVPFLVSRQILCGSGCIGGEGFRISQRSRYISEVTHTASTQMRPIIHQKNEELADPEKWRRLHLILGDANMSEVSTFLKVGTTALVLRMIEDGFFENQIELENPVAALHAFSADPACRTQVACFSAEPFAGYSLISAAEIQEIYCRWAKKYLEGFSAVEPEWRELTDRWERAIGCLKEDPMRLCREVDWVAKKWLMESLLEKYGCDWTNFWEKIIGPDDESLLDLLKTVDLLYHDIRRDVGLYYLLEKDGRVEKLAGDEDVERAETEPPQDTRAKWRVEFMKFAADERCEGLAFQAANWDSILVTGSVKDREDLVNPTDLFYHNRTFRRFDPSDSRLPDIAEVLDE